MTSFQQISQRKCPTPYQKYNLEDEDEIHQEQVHGVPQDSVIHQSSYSPLLLHFPKVPTKVVGEVTFNIQRLCCEFIDSSGTELTDHM